MNSKRSVRGLIVALIIGVGALAGTGAAAASEYPGWVVNEVPLPSGETAAFTDTNTTTLTLEVSGLVTLSAAAGNCTIAGSLRGTAFEAPDEMENTFLSCTGMTVKGSENCQVHTGKEAEGVFKTNKLKGTLAWVASTGGATGTILKPASGTELATVVIQAKTGKTCALSGTNVLSHEVLAKFLPVEEDVETAELSFPSTAALTYWSSASPRVEQKVTQLNFGARATTLSSTFAMKLQAGGKVGAAGKVTTKLCKVAPAPKCAAANVYPSTPLAKLAIEATDEFPAQQKNSFTLVTLMPPAAFGITCLKSKLTAETEAPEGAPLPVKNFRVELNECTTQNGTACAKAEMTNKPVNGSLEAFPNNAGHGGLLMPVTFEFICGAAPEIKCRYTNANFVLSVSGANVATIRPGGDPFVKQAIAGEAGCLDLLDWSAAYAVAKPQPVWVSQ